MNKRCESGSTVVTNSRTVLDRGLIPDNTDILDWLIRHRCVFTINGDSYRLMSAREEKLPEEETINRYNLMAALLDGFFKSATPQYIATNLLVHHYIDY